MPVTLKDIARELGVSAHSVSAVLNGNAKNYRISAATCERVMEMAQRMGYDPEDNRSARQMAARKHGVKIRSNVLAVCSMATSVPLNRHPFEGEILDGIESRADAHGVDVLQCRLRDGRLPRLMEKGEVDGIIMLSGHPEDFRNVQRLPVPVVVAGGTFPGCHSIVIEHFQGAYLATNHLIQAGHRHIAYIGHTAAIAAEASSLLDAAGGRLAGYLAAMRDAGLEVESLDHSLPTYFEEYGGRSFAKLWAESNGAITAVVCYNDNLAMGVVRSAQALHLEVPGELSVIGFDAISRQYEFEPELTSVGYDLFQLGAQSVEMLMNLREAEPRTGEQEASNMHLPVHLESGATTAAPRAKAHPIFSPKKDTSC